MKVTKLVVGILQIVLSLIILLQSCAVGIGHAVKQNTKDSGGTVGAFVGILFLACGIVYIATRKMEKMGGDIATLIMMLIAWILAIANAHDYQDLLIWGWLSFIIGVGFFVWHLLVNHKVSKAE